MSSPPIEASGDVRADVTYLDTSVALAHVLAEDKHPPDELWARTLLSSRLLEFEMWTRIHQRGLTQSHENSVRALLDRVAFLDLIPEVVTRAPSRSPRRCVRWMRCTWALSSSCVPKV